MQSLYENIFLSKSYLVPLYISHVIFTGHKLQSGMITNTFIMVFTKYFLFRQKKEIFLKESILATEYYFYVTHSTL